MRTSKLALTAGFMAATLAFATPATATITFQSGGQGTNQGQEVLLNVNPDDGTTVYGSTNQTHDEVTFVSSQTLSNNPNGQALIEAVGDTLNNLTFYMTDPTLGWTYVEFNLFNGANFGDAVSVDITGIDQFGNPFTTTLDNLNPNGQNWTIGLTADDQIITSVSFQTPAGGFTDFRQLRVDVAPIPGVPEPATWVMMFLGMGLVGSSLRRRRLRQSCPVVIA